MNRATRDALRRFQEQQGLTADGIAGPETERALIEAKTNQSAQAEGASGSGEIEYLDPGEFEWEGEVKPIPTSRKMPQGPFGILTITAPRLLRFTYAFTPEDALWTARFIVGEAGGRNDPDNRAVIWAMFNRYAFFTHKYYKTFHHFLRAYSTPLQPVLKNWGAARRHVHKPEFVRIGGFYKSPPAPPGIPRGQLKRFLSLQSIPWNRLPRNARSLAERALRGQVPNPIGNASEFASTYIFFRHEYRRNPSNDEWRQYTEAYARKKGRIWIGPVSGLDQKKNAFFFANKSVTSLPKGTVRVRNPASMELMPAGVKKLESFDTKWADLERLELDESEDWFDKLLELRTVPKQIEGPHGRAYSTRLRNTPGVAWGGKELREVTKESRWLRGQGMAAKMPKQVADKLRGRRFTSFRRLQEAIWKEIASNPDLSKAFEGFDPCNICRMQLGVAPIAPKEKQLGKKRSYEIDHIVEIQHGGAAAVYNLGNIQILSPLYHARGKLRRLREVVGVNL